MSPWDRVSIVPEEGPLKIVLAKKGDASILLDDESLGKLAKRIFAEVGPDLGSKLTPEERRKRAVEEVAAPSGWRFWG